MTPELHLVPNRAPNLLVDDHRLPGRLAELLRAGGTVLLCSRASAEGGEKARDMAVGGIYIAAEHLARQGRDVRPELPPREQLLTLVRTQAERTEHSDSGGGQFLSFRYCHQEQSHHGVVLLVQYGTGVRLTEDYQQPAVLGVADAVRQHHPVLLYSPEIRGIGRTGFGLSELVRELYRQADRLGEPVYVGDLQRRIRPFGPEVERDWFHDGSRLADEARDTYTRTRDAMANHCPRGLVSGWFRYPLVNALPPPFATARVRLPGETPFMVAFLDHPGCRPPVELVLYGLAETGPDGTEPASQLENVRWFYRNYLRDGWDLLATAQYLVAHDYTTMATRRRRGPQATMLMRTDPAHRHSDASHLVRSIWKHHEFHRTGRLVLAIDPNRSVEWQVQTPDGEPIARAEDVDRIARALAQQRSLRPRPRVHTFTGLPLLLNGEPVTLTPVSGPDGPRYRYTRTQQRIRGARRRFPGVPLPASVLTGAIVTALTGPDVVLLPRQPPPAALAQAEAARDAARQDAVTAERARTAAAAHVVKPELHGSGLAAAQAALDLAERRLLTVRQVLEGAETALRALVDHATAVPVAELVAMVRALQDPRDATFRRAWREAIDDFTATSERRSMMPDLAVGELAFSFTLTLADDQGRLWRLPVTGRHVQDASARLHERMAATIAAMRQGVSPRDTLGSNWRGWLPHLRAALGGEPFGANLVVNITDPRLLRIGMAICSPPLTGPPPGVTGVNPDDMPALVGPPLSRPARTRLARRLGEPPELLERLAAVYLGSDLRIGSWLRPPSPRTASLLEEAHRRPLVRSDLPSNAPNTGVGLPIFEEVRGRFMPRACPHCGRRHRRLSRLREVTGLLCVRCRRDDAGIRWSPGYDVYLSTPTHPEP